MHAARPRSGVTIGWAGGVGHKASLARWEPAIRNVLRARPRGALRVRRPPRRRRVRRGVRRRAGRSPTRRAGIEVYPASMTLFDLSIAPSAENNQFRGKSDLRWLEASAIGIPLVAHPDVYPDIEDGETGVHASTPDEVEAALLRLIDNPRASASASARTAHELRRRAPPHRDHGRELARGPRRGPRAGRRQPDRRNSLQVRSRLPTTSVSQGRRQQEPYRASPPPPLSQFEVHTGRWRATQHTPPRDGSHGRPLRRSPVCVLTTKLAPRGFSTGSNDPMLVEK